MAQKGPSPGRSCLVITLADPCGGWKNLCRLEKWIENSIIIYDWEKQNKHLVFICMSIPRIFCHLTTFSKCWRDLKRKKKRMVWHGGRGCWFLSLSLSVYCQEILTNVDCQGVKVTLLLNWERKLAGFCALCSAITEFQKQEPGALYEGTREVKGKSHRVTYQGIVPDKLLTWRWKNFMHTFCAKKPNGWAERSSSKNWSR